MPTLITRLILTSALAAAGLTACTPSPPKAAATLPAKPPAAPISWTADNGNGTYSNPLFYEEFSDPDVIRVGTDYYLAGTTMHAMPGLIVLHSKDLVNWELASYAFDRLDLAPSFHLEGGDIYGQGIWAPCIRHHNGTFYLFSNINNFGTHVFRSKSPNGPWEHNVLPTTLYDLSVLFDDDGKIYAIHGVREIFISQLNDAVTDVVPDTRRTLIPSGRGMGEGLHAYKINGKYYIVSAIPGAHTPMVAARADTLAGPWTVETLVAGESMGVPTGNSLRTTGRGANMTYQVVPHDPNEAGGLTIHQGGIVDTPSGQWWSVIMQDHNSVGRLSCLAPITWTDGWPLLGLPGNLRRAPRSWVMPDTGHSQAPKPLFDRNDAFDGPALKPVWQWNHVPDDTKWSLAEQPGQLRLHSLPAADFWRARNTLTQRAIGPESTVTVELDARHGAPGDTAGLALLNSPYAWIGLVRTPQGLTLNQYIQTTNKTVSQPAPAERLWLRAACNFDTEIATFSTSTDGKTFTPFGEPFTMVFQLRTFQGIRYSLFHYNTAGGPGGFVDFDNYTVHEPRPRGLTRPIPDRKAVTFTTLAGDAVLTADGDTLKAAPPAQAAEAGQLVVESRGPGRVSLAVGGRYVTVSPAGDAVTLVAGPPGNAQTFQWVDMGGGDVALMSLVNHRYLLAKPGAAVVANHPGPRPDHKDGSCFIWAVATSVLNKP
jgi:beta-xylosidase